MQENESEIVPILWNITREEFKKRLNACKEKAKRARELRNSKNKELR